MKVQLASSSWDPTFAALCILRKVVLVVTIITCLVVDTAFCVSLNELSAVHNILHSPARFITP